MNYSCAFFSKSLVTFKISASIRQVKQRWRHLLDFIKTELYPEKSRLNDDAKVVIIIHTDKNKYLKENKYNKYDFIFYKAFLYNPPV